MKKGILAIALLATVAFVGCSKDDDDNHDDHDHDQVKTCVTCDVTGSPSIEICKGDNGNAEVGGIDTGVEYDSYVATISLTGACN